MQEIMNKRTSPQKSQKTKDLDLLLETFKQKMALQPHQSRIFATLANELHLI
jgi:hypothetical protein